MPGLCPSSLQMYACINVVQYVWGWTNDFERLALLGLALMLVWTFVVVWRVSGRCRAAQRASNIERFSPAFQRDCRTLRANLNIQLGSLKSIAFTAPYLGLAGTCFGMLGIFRSYAGSRYGWLVMAESSIYAAFASTVAGLLVAIPAVLFYNYLHSRVDSLKTPSEASLQTCGHARFAETLPLLPRLSQVCFAVIAAPALVISIAALVTYSSLFNTRRGLYVALDSAPCEYERHESLVIMRLTNKSEIFINGERTDWDMLDHRLWGIYRPRRVRILYLVAEDGVPFQRVADLLDIAVGVRPNTRKITVQLVTPRALSDPCLGPAVISSSQRASR